MIDKITVLGAGTMGRSIAQLFAQHDFTVALYDPINKSLDEAQRRIKGEHIDAKISFTTFLIDAVENADLIIECAPENLELKQELFQQISLYLKESAIIASNTSSFPLEKLAQQQVFADRIVITHFFNPAHLVPLVEIVQLPSTQPHIAGQMIQLMERCGKVPVLLNKDIEGFIANRLQAAVMREAAFLLESGVADAKQIDLAMTAGPGMRWAVSGPFEIADYGGLDVWHKVMDQLCPLLNNRQDSPVLLQEKVKNGELGVKSGSGIYPYGDPDALQQRSKVRDQHFLQIAKLTTMSSKSNRV